MSTTRGSALRRALLERARDAGWFRGYEYLGNFYREGAPDLLIAPDLSRSGRYLLLAFARLEDSEARGGIALALARLAATPGAEEALSKAKGLECLEEAVDCGKVRPGEEAELRALLSSD